MTPIIEGHVTATTLAGRASLTIHQYVPPAFCREVVTVMLEPAEVLALATQLTRAAVPPPPVIRRRLHVYRDAETGWWRYTCPECFPSTASWQNQSTALAAATEHLAIEHAGETARRF